MKTGEQFKCTNCLNVGQLDIHGGCEECHSKSVVSVELISLLASKTFPLTSHYERRSQSS